MKCQNCNHTIDRWRSSCPQCQQRIKPVTYSTITNTPTETLEDHARRKLLRNVLQFALLAVAIIAVASVIRLSTPKANPTQQTSAAPKPSNAATPAPIIAATPPPAIETANALSAVAVPPTTAAQIVPEKSAPIAIFSHEVMLRAMPQSAGMRVPTAMSRSNQTPLTTIHKAELKEGVTDEALPKKLAKLTKETSAPPTTVAAPTEVVEPSLELEASNVALNPNTGLLTIKSYVPARLYIDGVFSGVTPRSVKLLAGDHVVTLLADGYQEYTRKVIVNGKQQMGILASMNKKSER